MGTGRRVGWGEAAAAGSGLVALTVMVTMAVTMGPVGVPPAAADELPAFDSCADLQHWYAEVARSRVSAWGLQGQAYGFGPVTALASGGAVRMAVPAPAPDSATKAASPGSAAGSGVAATGTSDTGTNVQEAGVDEPDLVKVHGSDLLVVAQGRFYVVDASGAAPTVVGSVALPQQRGTEMLVDGDRALVVGEQALMRGGVSSGVRGGPAVDVAPLPVPTPGGRPYQPTAQLTVVDFADRAHPAVVQSEDVDGTYLSARLHDGVVRVVLNHTPALAFESPTTTASESQALRLNQLVVANTTAQDWLPRRTVYDGSGQQVAQGPAVDCAAVRHPTEPSGLGTLTILTMGLRGDQPLSHAGSDGVAAAGDIVYSSTDRLYVATTTWGWARPMAGQVTTTSDHPTTQLHAFDATATTHTPYVASGTVDGTLLGSWALSEWHGYLRVATTVRSMTGGSSESEVDVLAEDGATLKQVGHLAGLGLTEQVRAVRWLGDLAAIVTFRQTDPLYLVDLSTPSAPTVAGELKVPGYSTYLHPVGDGLLLGIGRVADAQGHVHTDTGRWFDAKASLYDVRDPAHPRELSTLLLGSVWTELESQQTHAFAYLPDRHLAVLPANGTMGGNEVIGVRVEDRTLSDGGRATVPDAQRAVPVGDRLAAVGWSAVTLLDPDGLAVTGSAPLG